MTIYADNASAITHANNNMLTAKSKNIGIAYHCVRDYIQKGLITLMYKHTDDPVADCMTKPLPRSNLNKCKLLLGLE